MYCEVEGSEVIVESKAKLAAGIGAQLTLGAFHRWEIS
jgi:hypothetical protein